MENYSIIKQIGEGSYGKVSLAKDPQGRQVVLKVVDTRRMGFKEKKVAMNEVKVLRDLKHPYIIRYYDSFLSNGKLQIVMAFAEKGDLYSRIKKAKQGQPIPQDQVLEWFTQGILALKYLHDKHILHRDLKTQNLFLTAENRLKVGDFGISRVLDSTCALAKTCIGTPYYMSPEVCSERPYSWASDIWSMGCVLYELYMLRVPFEAQSIRQLMQRIVRGLIPRCTRAPAEMQQLCFELMSRDPKQRPSAAMILERPHIQANIRAMLKQHHEKSTSGFDQGQAEPCKKPEEPKPPVYEPQRPLSERAPSPSPRPMQAQARAASPAPMPRGLPRPSPIAREPSAGQLLLDGRHPVRLPSPRYHSPVPGARHRLPTPGRQMSPRPGSRAASPHRVASPQYAPRCASPQRYVPGMPFAPGVPENPPAPRDWYARAIGVIR